MKGGKPSICVCASLWQYFHPHPSSLSPPFPLQHLLPLSALKEAPLYFLCAGLEGISWHKLGSQPCWDRVPTSASPHYSDLGQSFSLSPPCLRDTDPSSSLLTGFSSFQSHSKLPCWQKFRSLLGISPEGQETLYQSQLYQSQLYHGVPPNPSPVFATSSPEKQVMYRAIFLFLKCLSSCRGLSSLSQVVAQRLWCHWWLREVTRQPRMVLWGKVPVPFAPIIHEPKALVRPPKIHRWKDSVVTNRQEYHLPNPALWIHFGWFSASAENAIKSRVES